MANPKHFLRARSYPGEATLDVWLIRRDGDAETGLLYGRMFPKTLDGVASATGLEVEREERPQPLPAPVLGHAQPAESLRVCDVCKERIEGNDYTFWREDDGSLACRHNRCDEAKA